MENISVINLGLVIVSPSTKAEKVGRSLPTPTSAMQQKRCRINIYKIFAILHVNESLMDLDRIMIRTVRMSP